MVSFLTCYGGMCSEEWAEYMTAISHFTSPAWVQSTHHHPDLYKLQRPGTIIDYFVLFYSVAEVFSALKEGCGCSVLCVRERPGCDMTVQMSLLKKLKLWLVM